MVLARCRIPGVALRSTKPASPRVAHTRRIHREPHSVLGDITPDNVRHLEVAWVHRTGDVTQGRRVRHLQRSSHPVMVDGILQLSLRLVEHSRLILSPARNSGALTRTLTVGLHSGQSDDAGAFSMDGFACDPRRKCAQRVFLATFDSRLFSLDALSGQPCEGFGNKGWLDLGADVARIGGTSRSVQADCTARDSQGRGRRRDRASSIIGSLMHRAVWCGGSTYELVPCFGLGSLFWGCPIIPRTELNCRREQATPGPRSPRTKKTTWCSSRPAAPARTTMAFGDLAKPLPQFAGGVARTTGEVVWTIKWCTTTFGITTCLPPHFSSRSPGWCRIPAVVQSTKMGYLFFFHRITGSCYSRSKKDLFPLATYLAKRLGRLNLFPCYQRPCMGRL
ncbi:MAG: hypothetical protein Ct9H300mP15_13810 [Gemmatimonadota bacterium]|nr:MAG: hypothetical protein Ct9H300mP15_13810 [Gemmatimonadota bacterium]